ncbi:phosphatase PAP2 family protein [Geodermatophilus sp. SYSU D01180]
MVAGLAAFVWHSRRPGPADAEMMRLQEAARIRGDAVATAIADAVGPSVVLVGLLGVALAWRAKQWDAVALALVVPPATLVVELLLKQIVHRQRPEGVALLYPSGHVAVATAAALTTVLVVRATPASSRAKARVAWVAGSAVVVVAAARLVQTVHYVTDVVGGAALGLAVTCWAVLAITTVWRSGPLGVPRSRPRGRRGTPGRGRGARADPDRSWSG